LERFPGDVTTRNLTPGRRFRLGRRSCFWLHGFARFWPACTLLHGTNKTENGTPYPPAVQRATRNVLAFNTLRRFPCTVFGSAVQAPARIVQGISYNSLIYIYIWAARCTKGEKGGCGRFLLRFDNCTAATIAKARRFYCKCQQFAPSRAVFGGRRILNRAGRAAGRVAGAPGGDRRVRILRGLAIHPDVPGGTRKMHLKRKGARNYATPPPAAFTRRQISPR